MDLIKLIVAFIVAIPLVVWVVAYRWGGTAEPWRAAEPARVRWLVPRPWWVRFGLMGVGSRDTAVNFSWASAGSAASAFVSSMLNGLPLWGYAMGGALLVAAAGYRLCIRWVDRNGAWPSFGSRRK
jgi:hypothetical protein